MRTFRLTTSTLLVDNYYLVDTVLGMSDAAVRVEIVREADASGEVAELYDEIRELFLGFVPDVFKPRPARPLHRRAPQHVRRRGSPP